MKGASAKNESKLNFFTSLFNVGTTVKLEVCHLTEDLLDPVSLHPNFAKTSMCNFTDGLVLSAFGKQQQDWVSNPVAVSNAGVTVNTVKESKREIARFVACRLRVQAPPTSPGVPSTIAPFSVAVLITLPLMQSASGVDVAADYIAPDHPASPKKLIAAIIQNTGAPPEIGFMRQEGELFTIRDIEG